MGTKTKIILAAVAAVVVAVSLVLLWRATHVSGKKIIIQKRAIVKKAAKNKETLPPVQKKFSNPKVVIVMDDFGYNMNDLDTIFTAGVPLTFSVLPNLAYSRRVALLANSKGYEVILHLPLEANDKSAPAESGTIRTDMGEKEILSMLERDIASVPPLKGVSNHQGSKATEDNAVMAVILNDLKKRGLFYFDSLVTDKSVCRALAKQTGVRYAKRDMFLDNTPSPDYIEKQVLALRRLAFRRGSAIAVCHDRKNTIAVLSRMMPELSGEGIRFVQLSDMVN